MSEYAKETPDEIRYFEKYLDDPDCVLPKTDEETLLKICLRSCMR